MTNKFDLTIIDTYCEYCAAQCGGYCNCEKNCDECEDKTDCPIGGCRRYKD